MHLAFELPRFRSSRSFRRLVVRPKQRRLKSKNALKDAATAEEPIFEATAEERYLQRGELKLPIATL